MWCAHVVEAKGVLDTLGTAERQKITLEINRVEPMLPPC